MKNDIRSSGIGIVGNIPWGTHFSQFYQTKEDLFEIIIPYFKTGLENNEFCLWITSDIIEVKEARKILKEFISDIDFYSEKGQIKIIPFTDFYSKEGVFDGQKALNDIINRANQALTSGYDGLRLIENVCSFKKEKLDNFIDYEERLNFVIGEYPIIALCTYSLEMCSITDAVEIAANHDFVLTKKKSKWEQIKNLGRKNITKLKQTENALEVGHTKDKKALQGSEERYHMLFDYIDEGFCLIEKIATEPGKPKNFRYIEANRAFEKHTGLKNAVGKAILDLVPEAEQSIMEIYDRVTLTGEPIRFEAYVAALDLWIDTYAFRIGAPELRQVAVIFKNVNKRKKAEKALLEREAMYRKLFETSNDGFWWVNRQGYITETNEGMAKMLGYRVDELIGRNWVEFVDKEWMERANKLWEYQKPGKPPSRYDFKMKKDGSLIWVQVSGSSVMDEQGRFVGNLSAFTDITESKRAEEALRLSEERFAKTFAHSAAAMSLVRLSDGVYLEVNKAWIDMFGYSYNDIIGRTSSQFEIWADEDAREKIYRTLRDKGSIHKEEFTMRRASGEQCFALVSAEIIAMVNEQAILTSTLDITDRKRAEEALRKSEERQAFLLKLSDALRPLSDPIEIQLRACRVLGEYLGANRVLYGDVVDEEETIISRDYVNGAPSIAAHLKATDFSQFTIDAYKTGQFVIINDVSSDPRLSEQERKAYGSINVAANVSLGLVKNGKWVAAFGAHNATPRTWTESEISLVQETAERTWAAVERARAEEALRESEAHLRVAKAIEAERQRFFNILETLPTMICLLTPDYQVVFANHAFRERFGGSEGKYCYEHCFGLTKPCEFCEAYKVLEISQPHHWEATMPDGSVIDAYDFPFTDVDGSPMILEMHIDITERIKAEEKIQTLANVVESSNDAIVTESLEGVILSWNKGAEQIYGYSAKEVIGKPISILDPSMLVGETVELAELIKQGDKIHNYETLRLRKDGTIINVSLTLSPVYDASGELAAISVIARNITKSKNTEKELKQSEERYRIVTEQTGQMVYDYDLKLFKNKFAGAIEEVTGYNFEEFRKLGKDFWTENILDSDPNRVYEKSQDKKTGDRFKEELRLRRKDGTYGYIENSGVYLMDNDGQPYRAIGVLRDITEKREAEKALAEIDKLRIKEIHHRIKNNLQVISSLLDLQAEKFENETVKKAFGESQDRVVSMALIHEELYKGEGTHTDTLDFSAYLQKLAENLFQTYSLISKNIHLCTDLEENAFFDMDTAIPLGIVVNELVSNSLKHAFQGKDNGEIRIELHREESKRKDYKSASFTLTNSDNGIGIPENLEIEDIDSLGLQLVTSLVDQLDGELELKRNNGTEFIIRFTVKER